MPGRAKRPHTKPAPIFIHRNSKREHVLDGDKCWCHPRVEEHRDEILVIHNDTPRHDA